MAFAAKVKIVAISAANGLYIITLLLLDWNFLTFNFFFMTITWLKFVNFYGYQLNFLAILRLTIYSFETLLQYTSLDILNAHEKQLEIQK